MLKKHADSNDFDKDRSVSLKRSTMCPWIHILPAMVFLGVLSACGVDTEKKPPVNTLTVLNDLAIYGEPGVDTNLDDTIVHMEVPMDKNERADAAFYTTWDISSSDPYYVTMYISDDPNLDTAVDQAFFETQCGTDNTLYPCNSLGDKICGFRYNPEYEYVIDSNTGEPAIDPVTGNLIRQTNPDGSYMVAVEHYYLNCVSTGAEITDYVIASGFPASPFNQYIIFNACNEMGDSCITSNFQFDIVDSIP